MVGPIRAFRYFSMNIREASRSELLNSYGTHQPMGPNFFLSITMECMKHTTKIRDLHWEWSILSMKS